MGIKEEIDEMTKSLTGDIKPSTEVPVPKTDAPSTEVPSPSTEAPTTEAPKEPEKKEEPKQPEPDERDKTIEQLRSKLAELEKPKEPIKKEEPKKEEIKFEEQDFIGEIDIDELSREPKKLNEVFNKIYQKASVDTMNRVYQSLPNVVKENLTVMEDLKRTNEEFYSSNEDLKPFKKVVAVVFEELLSKSPDKTLGEIIKDVAPEVRKRLELPPPKPKDQQKDPEPKKSEPPKLPKKGGQPGRSSDQPPSNPMMSEIDAMNKSLRR